MYLYPIPEQLVYGHSKFLSEELDREVRQLIVNDTNIITTSGNLTRPIILAMNAVIYLGTDPAPQYAITDSTDRLERSLACFNNTESRNRIIICNLTKNITNSVQYIQSRISDDKLHAGLTAALQVKRRILKVYYNQANNSYLIVTSAGHLTRLIMKIVALIPGILNLNTTTEAKEILANLVKQTNTDNVDVQPLIDYITDRLGTVLATRQHDNFVAWLAKSNSQEHDRLLKDKNRTETNIQRLLDSYSEQMCLLQDINRKIYMCDIQAKNVDYEAQVTEIMDMLSQVLQDGQLLQFSFSQTNILGIRFLTPLKYWDTDFVTTRLAKDNLNENSKIVYDMCFNKCKFKIYTMTAVNLQLDTKRIVCDRNYEHPSGMIVQPHIMHYNCFGANNRLIIDAMTSGNLMLALMQTVVAAQNINLMDSTVWNHFIDDLNYTITSKVKCFRDVDTGIDYTFAKVIEEYSKEHEEA